PPSKVVTQTLECSSRANTLSLSLRPHTASHRDLLSSLRMLLLRRKLCISSGWLERKASMRYSVMIELEAENVEIKASGSYRTSIAVESDQIVASPPSVSPYPLEILVSESFNPP